MATDFVVLDFETTGLIPGRDRVIEIGCVRTSANGRVVAEFSSLVNPNRDVGATAIHGITAGMLRDAPVFEEILAELRHVMNGAVLVAHNIAFDARFLDAELERLNHGRSEIDGLCTMEMMRRRYPGGRSRLLDCCTRLGLPILDAHEALADARMASTVLHRLLEMDGELDLPVPIDLAPAVGAARKPVTRRDQTQRATTGDGYVSRLLSQADWDGGPLLRVGSNESQYMNILEEALSDRLLTIDEARDLLEFAALVRMSREQVAELHEMYVGHLYLMAMADDELTQEERADLDLVADLLDVNAWEAKMSAMPDLAGLSIFESQEMSLRAGMSVCFTGEMVHPRSELEEMAHNAGIKVKSGVSRLLDVLVVADADSMSSKARKARELGVPIVAEQRFLALLRRNG